MLQGYRERPVRRFCRNLETSVRDPSQNDDDKNRKNKTKRMQSILNLWILLCKVAQSLRFICNSRSIFVVYWPQQTCAEERKILSPDRCTHSQLRLTKVKLYLLALALIL